MSGPRKAQCPKIKETTEAWLGCELFEDHKGECQFVLHPNNPSLLCNKRATLDGVSYFCCLPQGHDDGCISSIDEFCVPPPVVWSTFSLPSHCTNPVPGKKCGVQFVECGQQYVCIAPAGHRSLHTQEID